MLDDQTLYAGAGDRGAVLARLHTTLDTARLPDRMRLSGQTLADRLAAPVRLSFMGLPGAGKTTLIQALLGIDLPEMLQRPISGAPSFALAHGAHLHGQVTLENGMSHNLVDPYRPAEVQEGAVYAEMHVPCDRLRDLQIFELATDGSIEELSMAVPWAAERCEIPIWCSHQFHQTEADIWAQVPDRFKDHAILALTQADRLTPDQMTQWLDTAHDGADAGFSIIAPVAAKRAYDAQIAVDEDADKIMQACGISALWQEITHRVEQGRQTDLENAELFLKRFERPISRRVTEYSSLSAEEVMASPKSNAFAQADMYLRRHAADMLADIEEFGPFADTRIVERCLEAANHLVDLLADEAPNSDAQAQAWDAVTDAADMLLLTTLEKTSGAAEDAVHLLLQLQREVGLAV